MGRTPHNVRIVDSPTQNSRDLPRVEGNENFDDRVPLQAFNSDSPQHLNSLANSIDVGVGVTQRHIVATAQMDIQEAYKKIEEDVGDNLPAFEERTQAYTDSLFDNVEGGILPAPMQQRIRQTADVTSRQARSRITAKYADRLQKYVLDTGDTLSEQLYQNSLSLADAYSKNDHSAVEDLLWERQNISADLGSVINTELSEGLSAMTPAQRKALEEQAVRQQGDAFLMGLIDADLAGGKKILRDAERGDLKIPVLNEAGEVEEMSLRDYINDPKVMGQVVRSATTYYNKMATKETKANYNEYRLARGRALLAGEIDYNPDADIDVGDKTISDKSAMEYAYNYDRQNGTLGQTDAEIVGNLRTMPTQLRGRLESGLSSTDPARWDEADQLYQQLRAENPNLAGEMLGESHMKKLLRYSGLVEAGVPPEDAVATSMEITSLSQTAPTLIESRRAELKELDMRELAVDAYSDSPNAPSYFTFGDGDPDSPVAMEMMEVEQSIYASRFRNLFTATYLETGNEDVAMKFARDKLNQSFGYTNINGGRTFMEYPPEQDPYFHRYDPKDLKFREQLMDFADAGIQRLRDAGMEIKDGWGDRITIVADRKYIQASKESTGRIPYRIYYKDDFGAVRDITNPAGTPNNPIVFGFGDAKPVRESQAEQAIKEALEYRKRRENDEAEDLGVAVP